MQNKTQIDFDFVFNPVCYVVEQFFLINYGSIKQIINLCLKDI